MPISPYYQKDGITIYCGDCLEVMPHLEPHSIDSEVTDPPYGLRFMGKEWDHGLPGVPFWQAALTVAKPGAMLLAFGGSRTYHRLTCAIEDAGWEIRDCVMWLYGSGFPKSHDISKAIDKQAGVEREVIGEKVGGAYSTNTKNVGIGEQLIDINGNTKDGRKIKPTRGNDFGKITAPATPAAELWDGWGTALKPSFEPIVLAMAPMPSTFAANALEYGVAGLWVDGCRVEANQGEYDIRHYTNEDCFQNKGPKKSKFQVKPQPSGRWPSNCIHDGSEEVLAGVPVSSTTGQRSAKSKQNQVNGTSWYYDNHHSKEYPNDSGSAARFFYCAKASKRERGDGNNHPTVKPLELVKYLCRLTRTPTGGTVLDPFCGSGTTLLAARAEGRQAVGIELNEEYCQIAVERLTTPTVSLPSTPKSRNGKQAKQMELELDAN